LTAEREYPSLFLPRRKSTGAGERRLLEARPPGQGPAARERRDAVSGHAQLTLYTLYTNPRATSVGWGFGTQEMCELFGFADSTPLFESRVNAGSARGSDGDVQLFTGPCTTDVFPPPN
jgi:hypothetical protein